MNRVEPGQRGFTLVEMMVVVVIIGLLAAFAIPNYVKSRSAAQRSTCLNNLRQIENAIQQYQTEYKKVVDAPVSETDLLPYLKGQVICPAGGTSFSDSYQVTLCSELPTCKSPGGGAANGHVLLQ